MSMTSMEDDLFASYRKYKAKMVDSPWYEPLWQSVVSKEMVEDSKKKRISDYHKEYYKKNRERIRKYQRLYDRKRNENWNHRWDMIWNQKRVYEYLLEQYRKWKDSPRWTEIARALWIWENSVYTAIFKLTKKWYVGRGSYGRYILLKFPENEQITVNDIEITVNDIENTIDVLKERSKDEWKLFMTTEEDYNKLVHMNEELKKELGEVRKENEELKRQVDNSVGHIDSLMNSNSNLEEKNLSLCGQIEELKWVVKVLLRYFQ